MTESRLRLDGRTGRYAVHNHDGPLRAHVFGCHLIETETRGRFSYDVPSEDGTSYVRTTYDGDLAQFFDRWDQLWRFLTAVKVPSRPLRLALRASTLIELLVVRAIPLNGFLHVGEPPSESVIVLMGVEFQPRPPAKGQIGRSMVYVYPDNEFPLASTQRWVLLDGKGHIIPASIQSTDEPSIAA